MCLEEDSRTSLTFGQAQNLCRIGSILKTHPAFEPFPPSSSNLLIWSTILLTWMTTRTFYLQSLLLSLLLLSTKFRGITFKMWVRSLLKCRMSVLCSLLPWHFDSKPTPVTEEPLHDPLLWSSQLLSPLLSLPQEHQPPCSFVSTASHAHHRASLPPFLPMLIKSHLYYKVYLNTLFSCAVCYSPQPIVNSLNIALHFLFFTISIF